MLLGAVPAHATAFFVVACNQKRRAKTAYNPAIHGAQACLDTSAFPDPLAAEHNKRLHMHMIAAHFGLSTSELVLFDDDETNATQTGGDFLAVRVDERRGLRLADLARL